MKATLLRECLQRAQARNRGGRHPYQKGYRLYSFIIQDNTILSLGLNRREPPQTFYGYPSHSGRHAEIDAFKKAKGILDKDKPFDVINIRLGRSGKLRMSKPCPICEGILKHMGCRNIYFTTDIGFAKLM